MPFLTIHMHTEKDIKIYCGHMRKYGIIFMDFKIYYYFPGCMTTAIFII